MSDPDTHATLTSRRLGEPLWSEPAFREGLAGGYLVNHVLIPELGEAGYEVLRAELGELLFSFGLDDLHDLLVERLRRPIEPPAAEAPALEILRGEVASLRDELGELKSRLDDIVRRVCDELRAVPARVEEQLLSALAERLLPVLGEKLTRVAETDRGAPFEPPGSTVVEPPALPAPEHPPITTWLDAARALGVSTRTLKRRRDDAGDQTEPWWPDVAALKRWYGALLSPGGTKRAPRVRKAQRPTATTQGRTLADLKRIPKR
jgi:hypothetical protein